MWVFLLVSTLAWGIAEIFYKKGNLAHEKYSHLKTTVYVGFFMGIYATVILFTQGVDLKAFPLNFVRYLPVATCYILSMILSYFGVRFIEESIADPIENTSCAIVPILCAIFLKETLKLPVIIGIVLVAIGLICVGIFDKKGKNDRKTKLGKKLAIIAIAMPFCYMLLDGQQRTISICRYVTGVFSHNLRYFSNLQADEKEQILNYELQVYFCKGTDSEKLEWFKTINIAGERLSAQEIRNAVYAGTWTSEAKKIFSKSNCAAKLLSRDYVNGDPIRQELLETAIGWFVGEDDKLICNYMGLHKDDTDANELWLYFQMVISWIKALFPVYRKEMKGINWGLLYNQYHEKNSNYNN